MSSYLSWLIPLAEWPFGLRFEELTYLHLSLELLLLLWVLYLLLLAKPFKPHHPPSPSLTPAEIDDLVLDFEPTPLAPPLSASQRFELAHLPVLPASPQLNAATLDFRALSRNPKVTEHAERALRFYGCGACGPRGFYGTMDIHMELEKLLSRWLGVEEVCLYSSNFVVMGSALPAFCKMNDRVWVDERVGIASRLGASMSRAHVASFRHNDMRHLEDLIVEDERLRKKKGAKAYRRFVVVEGVYADTGNICDLRALLRIKREHHVRVFVDDTLGLGVLGRSGCGAIEHAGLRVADFDLVCGALGSVLAGTGGFSAGSAKFAVHQRLNSSGYVFSASLAPYLAAAGIAALTELQTHPEMLERLRLNVEVFRGRMKAAERVAGLGRNKEKWVRWKVLGDDAVPAVAVTLEGDAVEEGAVKGVLQAVVDAVQEQGVLLTRAKYVEDREYVRRVQTIRVAVTLHHDAEMLRRIADVMCSSLTQVVQSQK